MIPIALATTLLALAPPQEPQEDAPLVDPFVRSTLATEVELCVLHAPHAARQSLFAIYERGFFTDLKDMPQSAHLAEHLAIRSTDPDRLEVDGVLLNGETQGSTLRLEMIGLPEKWPAMTDRLARWMNALNVDPDVVEVERGRILQEVAATAPRGFTAKWAQAAWLQVVRYGAEEVRVGDGLVGTDANGGRRALGWHVRNARPMRIVVVGPREPETVRADLAEALKGAPGWKSATSIGAFGVRHSTWDVPTGDHAATWDLPGPHVVEWYPLPGDGPDDRAAGEGVAELLRMALQGAGVAREGTFVAVTLERMCIGTWGVWISFAPADDADPAEVRAALDGALARFLEQPGEKLAASLRWSAKMQPLVPDLAELRKQMAGGPGAEYFEAQIALNLADREARTGLTAVELRRLKLGLSAEALAEFAATTLRAENRGTLWLRPND